MTVTDARHRIEFDHHDVEFRDANKSVVHWLLASGYPLGFSGACDKPVGRSTGAGVRWGKADAREEVRQHASREILAGDERRGRMVDRWLIAAVTSQQRGRRDERQVRYPAPTLIAVGSSRPGARRAEQIPQLVRDVFTTTEPGRLPVPARLRAATLAQRALAPVATHRYSRRAGLLRYASPAYGLYRTVTRDVVFHGQQMHQGDRVMLVFPAASLDRSGTRHMAFGLGPHRWLGSHHARVMFRVMLGEILRRLPDYSLDGPAERFHDGRRVRDPAAVGSVHAWPARGVNARNAGPLRSRPLAGCPNTR